MGLASVGVSEKVEPLQMFAVVEEAPGLCTDGLGFPAVVFSVKGELPGLQLATRPAWSA